MYISDNNKPDRKTETLRKKVASHLAWRLQRVLGDNFMLHLFGSAANGFGFKRSDLDFCLVTAPTLRAVRGNYCIGVPTVCFQLCFDFHWTASYSQRYL